MNGEIYYVFGVLIASIVLFVSDRIRMDIVALMVILALSIGGILSPAEAVAGFGSTVVILILALFIVGEGLYYTGIALSIGDLIVRLAGNREAGLIIVLMLATSFISAFMSSTGAVAIFIPVAVRLAVKSGIAPSRLLMPMATGSLIGGMLTLIGTPPNLIANSQLVKAGLEPFSFFAFTPVGLIILTVAITYTLFVGRRLLPSVEGEGNERRTRRTLADLASMYGIEGHLVRLRIEPGSPLIGQTVVQAELRSNYGITVFGLERKVHRHTEILPILSKTVFAQGDILYAVNSADALHLFVADFGVTLLPYDEKKHKIAARDLGLADVLLLPDTPLIGLTLKQSRFRQIHDLSVLAVARGGEPLNGNFASAPLAFGDTMLVAGSWEQIRALRSRHKDFVVLSLPEELDENALGRKRAPHALAIVAVMLGLMAFELVPTVIAALLAAVAMVLFGCLPKARIYRCINWESLVLIAGMLPMATALDKTGGLDFVVKNLMAVVGNDSPVLVMVALFLLTSGLSQVISNTATTVLVVPVAFGLAELMGVAPQPLLMTVAISASCAFATPVASPVNTLVLGPGKYRFTDFVRVGLPLQVLVMVTAILVVPVFFPF